MILKINHRFLIAGIVLFAFFAVTDIFAQQPDSTHECTHAIILGPLAPGMKYIDGSDPILAYHKNNGATYYTRLYMKGDRSAKGDYTYQHTFIGIGRSWDGTYFQGLSVMNEKGNAINFANPDDPVGEDDYYVREIAAAMSDNLDELIDLVKPESWPNIVAVTGYNQCGDIKAGHVRKDAFTPVTPENPFIIEGKVAVSEGKSVLSNVDNWFHGDPEKLEVRDVAYCWHRFNTSSDFAAINVTRYNIMWCTSANTNDSPFIPFDLNDPYVYPKFQDGSYYNSANYSQQEIDEIEDIIMAPDGAVIGDVRDIQMRIAEGLPLISPSLYITSMSLPDGIIGETYNASLQAGGGTTPYTWTLISGKLPSGLTLNPSGTISGTPTQSEEQIFTVQVNDATNSTANQQFSITIRVLTTLTVSPNPVQMMNGQIQQFTAVGTDQYGNSITITPEWSVDGGGTIDTAGLFTANQVGGPFTVTAKSGIISGTAIVTVIEAVTIAEASFNQGEENFNYVDDPFRSTNQPDYSDGRWNSSGGYNGGALKVTIGGINSADILGMSAGWKYNFSLNAPTKILLSFRYNLTQASDYESDEFSQMLMSVDNVLYGETPNDYIAQFVGDGDGGSAKTTGWQLFEVNLGTLAAGEHTLVIGGYNNKKTNEREITEVLIDDVLFLDANKQVSAIFADDSQKTPKPNNSEHNIPESFSLYQNYPNPFNPSTTIAFDLPFNAKVTLNVFNVLGRKMATILDGTLAAGSYRYTWNVENESTMLLPSGVYFYQIEAVDDSYSHELQKSIVVTKKMILTK